MGFLDKLLGRSAPPAPDLDRLFAVPDAALSLEAAMGFKATGVGSVCFRPAEGGAFASATTEIQQLLDADDGPKVEKVEDAFGFTWLVCRQDPGDVSGLVTDLHAVNSTLQDRGFGPSLLCSLVAFTDPAGAAAGLVYLAKRGTFYPFVPRAEQRRDTATELQIRAAIEGDVPIEKELGRWFAVWGAPGL